MDDKVTYLEDELSSHLETIALESGELIHYPGSIGFVDPSKLDDQFLEELDEETKANPKKIIITGAGRNSKIPAVMSLLEDKGYTVQKLNESDILEVDPESVDKAWLGELTSYKSRGKNVPKGVKISLRRKNSYRNKPCVCGSGKKFKKCCWTKADV